MLTTNSKTMNSIVLFLLSVIVPGGGYVYQSRYKRAVLLYVMLCLIWVCWYLSGLYFCDRCIFNDMVVLSSKLISASLILLCAVDASSVDSLTIEINGNWRGFMLLFLSVWFTLGGAFSIYQYKEKKRKIQWWESVRQEQERNRIEREKQEDKKHEAEALELKREMSLALPKEQEDFYNRFYLVFLPEYGGHGKKNELGKEGRLFVRAGAKVEVGERFYVVSNSTNVVSGTLTEIREAMDKEFGSSSDTGYKVGIVKWDDGATMVQESFNARVLVYRGDDFLSENVGFVRNAPVPKREDEATIDIKKWDVFEHYIVGFPLTNGNCDFTSEYRCQDEQCVGMMDEEGVLACQGNVYREGSLFKIYAISDLNKDGIYEVLVNDGLTYSIRYFSAGKFLESPEGIRRKVLFGVAGC